MSNNIFEPLADAIYRYIKWNYDIWFCSDDFDFKKYFEIVKLCNKEEIYPKLVKKYNGKKGRVYLFNIPPGLSIKDFENHQEGIKAQLKYDLDIRYNGAFIEVETIEKTIADKIDYVLPKKSNDSIYFPIGESLEGTIYLDLKEHPHSYIVGTTGSGKSVMTKNILTNLINLYSPQQLELYLCDLKRVELNLFSRVKHCKKFVYTVEETTEVIADLLAETNRRYDLFMEHDVTNIFEYNKLPNVKKLKYQVLFLEEIVLLLEDKKKSAMKLLKQLIAISRASGLYVFLTTQRPSNDVIDNVVKANINNRIVFKCEDSKNSIVALDQEGAENLGGKGEGYLKQGANLTHFRGYFIEDDQVKEYIKPYINKAKPIIKANKESTVAPVVNEPIVENKKIVDLSFIDNI